MSTATGVVGTPANVTVISGVATRLPNAPGNGGCIIINDDLQYSVDIAPLNTFITQSTVTVRAGDPLTWSEGPAWARVTPGQVGNPASVEVTVLPGLSGLPQPPVTSALALLGTLPANASSVTITPSPSAVELVVTGANLENSDPFIMGTTTGIFLGQATISTYSAVFFLPAGGTDTEYKLLLGNPVNSPTYIFQSTSVLAMPVIASGAVEMTSPPVSVVPLAPPPAGTDWTFSVTGQRLLGVNAVLVTSATVASREPILVIAGLQYPMALVAQAAGNTFLYCGQPGHGEAWADATGRTSFGFPSAFLASGAVISSLTVGLQAGDQWSGIKLMLSAA